MEKRGGVERGGRIFFHAFASFLRGGKKEEKKRESRVSAFSAPRATFVYWANVGTGRKKCDTFVGIQIFFLVFFGLKFVLFFVAFL